MEDHKAVAELCFPWYTWIQDTSATAQQDMEERGLTKAVYFHFKTMTLEGVLLYGTVIPVVSQVCQGQEWSLSWDKD